MASLHNANMTTPKYRNTFRIPSARATWHDYDGGMYFVTICTKEKVHYFGEIIDGEMRLNELGQECVQQIEATPKIRPDVDITIPVYVVMPNHIHLIVCIDGSPNKDAMHCVSTEPGNKFQPQSKNLASVMRGLKSAVTIYARKNHISFSWQTRFHDRIIRNQKECNAIADYIENNPMNWHLDELNIF